MEYPTRVETVRLARIVEDENSTTIEFTGPKNLPGYSLYSEITDPDEEYMSLWIELNRLKDTEDYRLYHRFCEELITRLYKAITGLK